MIGNHTPPPLPPPCCPAAKRPPGDSLAAPLPTPMATTRPPRGAYVVGRQQSESAPPAPAPEPAQASQPVLPAVNESMPALPSLPVASAATESQPTRGGAGGGPLQPCAEADVVQSQASGGGRLSEGGIPRGRRLSSSPQRGLKIQTSI